MTSAQITQPKDLDRLGRTVTIPSHFNGPPGCGHGGVAAGRFAAWIDAGAATVRFSKPIPLDTNLFAVQVSTDEVEVRSVDGAVAGVRQLRTDLKTSRFEVAAPTVLADAEARSFAAPGAEHPFPTCFGCGNDRGDTGLGLTPGPIGSSGAFVASWSPSTTGEVEPGMIWAALDCPSGAPALAQVEGDLTVVTGELSVQIMRPVNGARTYQIHSRTTKRSGRKICTEAALIDEHGSLLAAAAATWIAVSPAIGGAS